MKKCSGKVDVKCYQSCLIALVFCTKLYIKLAVSLCSFSQFSFPFHFRTANAYDLKIGTLPLGCLFSNTLLAIFDILFRSRIIHRFAPKMCQNWHAGVFFNITLFQKRILKTQSSVFLVHRFYLLRKQKEFFWKGRFST